MAPKVFVVDPNLALEVLKVTSGHVVVFGPPGTGKTTLATLLADWLGQSVLWNTNCTPNGSSGLIVGHPQVQEGAGYWAYGPALQAWKRGELYLIDDLHKVSSDAEAELLTILNPVHLAQKTLPYGTVVKAEPGFRGIAAMNGIPDDLDPALRDRFKVALLIREPSDTMLDRLDPDVRALCQNAYRAADPMIGQLPKFSFRECLAFTELRKELAVSPAFDSDKIDELAAELSLDGDPTRARGFLDVIGIAKAAGPDEDDDEE